VNHLLTRVPVNKMAAMMVNQCRCSSELELNSLLEQRRQLKANATFWMKSKNPKKYNSEIRQVNKDLQKLNGQLKPYDEWHRQNTAKDFDSAFRLVVKNTFGMDVFKQLEAQAKSACGDI